MNIKFSRALCATTALATGLLMASGAMAQSTGTAVLEELVVTGATGPKNLDGAIVAIDAPKSRASITEEFISRQAPGQTILDSINLLPSVNFTNNDAYGSAGGDITIRGFDSQRVALLQDGVPLNDSGNYAIYPNQQLESDLIERATVNLGTTDVDSPTAAAAGGTINYITKKASKDFGVRAELGYGSDEFQRYYGTIESGEIGPFGTRMWVSGLYTRNDLVKPHNSPISPSGKIQKKQFNARIDQDFGDIGWASLLLNYNENRNNFINRISLATFARQGVTAAGLPDTSLVSPTSCLRPTPAAGTAQVDNSTGFACTTGYYDFNINPSNTGNIRGLSSWKLGEQFTLTVDPSFQYVLANGGGVGLFSETDAQLRGNTTSAGVDLNGDGDILDRVYLYRPNTTNTRRYGVTSSLIWKFADNQSVRVAYTFDRAKHRQTGDVGYVDAGRHARERVRRQGWRRPPDRPARRHQPAPPRPPVDRHAQSGLGRVPRPVPRGQAAGQRRRPRTLLQARPEQLLLPAEHLQRLLHHADWHARGRHQRRHRQAAGDLPGRGAELQRHPALRPAAFVHAQV